MDWDDLKYLLAVADGGGLAGAARDLKVDPSTVSRRITALEKGLAVQLMERTPEGMTLTVAGQQVLAVARSVQAQLGELAARLVTTEAPCGTLRITTTDSFAPWVLRASASMRERYPQLVIELSPSTATVDLRRREADLAVRMFRDEHDGLALRRLGTLGWSLYASEPYLATVERGPLLLDGHRIIGYSDSRRAMVGASWLVEHARPEAIALRVDSTRAALDAVLAHAGVCIIPCYVAAGQPLRRLTDQVLATTDVFACFLPERRTEPKVRVGLDMLVELFDSQRAVFSG